MLIGTAAAKLLATPGFTGRILSTVSRAVYLWGAGEDLLWLAPPGAPGHTRCLVGAMVPHAWRAGTGFACLNQTLVFLDGLRLDLTFARIWDPALLYRDRAVSLAALRGGIPRMIESCQPFFSTDGLGPALPYPLGELRGGLEKTSLAALSGPVLAAVVKGCLAHDLAKVAEAGRELIGLGPGLTPAGDDFLGGLLFTLWHLKAVYSLSFASERQAVAGLLDWAYTRTNRISYTLLADMACGLGPAPLHKLVGLLLAGRDTDEVSRAARELAAIGHTSGGDLLAGAVTGMLLTLA